ncbi:MAG: phosphate ABC transporter permease subunit PstC [Candidatus Diapherotrites archaeon]|nr:phosphate ABC transporter permease subunit PstC [Candidatus Diapherotrites archaeon]
MNVSVAMREKLIETGFFLASLLAVLVLLGIFGFLLFTGIGAFSQISFGSFFFGTLWNPGAYAGPQWGILGLLVGTLMVTVGALVLAIPLGIGCAVYLSELASPRTREIIKPAIEMIAAIPSVVLGLIGLLFLSPLVAALFGVSSGLNALSASIVVAVMVLPTIISVSEDVLTSLPREFREASLALGADRFQTIFRVLIPAALPGIGAAIMLGLGRAVGETMAVLMVAGNALAMPESFLDPVRPMTANIAIEIKEVVQGSLHYEALFAIGLVLFILTFLVNLLATLVIERHARRFQW